MNLTTDPWIPIIWESGAPDKVSLRDAFLRGHEIRDLAVRPHERIALMRLLICVAQAALDGPKDHAEWQTCHERLPQVAADYLGQWRHAFELFGDGQRFLQVTDVRSISARGDDQGGDVAKLDLDLAAGNMPTLFDNAAGGTRAFGPDRIALTLLTFQSFSPGGLIGNVAWAGNAMGRSSNHAPCIVKSMVHTYRKGGDLQETVHGNLLHKEQLARAGVVWGLPVWVRPPVSIDDASAVQNACATYLGRLVPLARAVCLESGGTRMVMGNALTYSPDWREPAATVVVRDRDGVPERVLVSGSLEKSIWRELHSIATLSTFAKDGLGGPWTLANGDAVERGCDIWVGALAANKSKLLDTIESVFHLPAPIFADVGQRLYQNGIQQAEQGASRLRRAVSAYHREYKDDLDRFEFRKRGNLVKQKATTHYWTAVEQHVSDLLVIVENPALLGPDLAHPTWGTTEWGQGIFRAVRAAYDLACPHQTPRQMKAHALGLRALFAKSASHAEADANTDTKADTDTDQ
ncbi:MAG: type I-E CRISPR-associated protein Cse1/CasA [Lentisphaerae bacterium RIFOXYB12_FULL_65_16]|nr:MAG: type I-E CRISPR-associated protein Cse1/CasA [Lentisphaerae bacterium RIFOXYA12_64_32]OGV94028.1 MAG: type I-E CRISPR-associated protein Cse1/CasA [Lentisphaerae bacterium RIFOXYB12_FULL_65_16]